MEFNRKNNIITIISEKKNIVLDTEKLILDELEIDCAGEYEKSGFLLYVRTNEGLNFYHFRVEGFWIGFIPAIPANLPAEIAEFFGQLDILVAPFSKSEKNFIEQIEPKMLISFSDFAADLTQILGTEISSGNSYKPKSQDISSEKTSLVILSE